MAGELRQFGGVFDGVAAAYDAVRPSYPLALVDAAIAEGSLDSGSVVLEIGSGTGKLTELLVGRGLRVRAVEPGANLVEMAQKRLASPGAAQFEVARFEDARLPEGSFDAVFSATAFHWVDPAIGWRKVAALLAEDGMLALLTHISVHDERSAAMEHEMAGIVREHVRATEMGWTIPRTLDAVLTAARARSANASAVWDMIMGDGKHALAVPEAAALFTGVTVAAVPESQEQTADEVLAHLHTTSFWFRLEADRRESFERAYRAVIERNGGTYPSSSAAVLMIAKRAAELP